MIDNVYLCGFLFVDGDLQALLERDHVVMLKKRIQADTRRRVTVSEFQALAAGEGLSKEQTSRVLQALSDSGIEKTQTSPICDTRTPL